MKCISMAKQRILLTVTLLVFLFIIAFAFHTNAVFGEEATPSGEMIEVTTAKDLNEALGGIHTVGGNTVILQDDVTLSKRINITDAANAITLDMNGKTLSGKSSVDYLICVVRSKLTITGNGIFDAEKMSDEEKAYNNAKILLIGEQANVTIENSTFQSEDRPQISIGSVNINEPASLTINDGTFKGEAIYTDGGNGTLHLTVNGGSLGSISLYPPVYYAQGYDDFNKKASRHKVKLNGGTIESVSINETDCTITGGVIGKGGLDANLDSKVVVKDGKIEGPTSVWDGRLSMSGGKLKDTVVAGKFIMKGGFIVSSEAFGLTLSHSYDMGVSQITGGTIKTTKKGAKGIMVYDDSILKISGGKIISSGTKGSAGIYCAPMPDGDKEHTAKVYFQGVKGKKIQVKGYKYSVYRTKSNAKTTLKTYTRMRASEERKASFYAGQKLPRIVHGDATLVYTKVKKKAR